MKKKKKKEEVSCDHANCAGVQPNDSASSIGRVEIRGRMFGVCREMDGGASKQASKQASKFKIRPGEQAGCLCQYYFVYVMFTEV